MGGIIGLGQVLKIKPRVHLCGGDVGMAQQFLHGPQVPAGLQQVAGKTVPQHVRMHRGGQPGLLAAGFKALPDTLRCQAGAVLADEERVVRGRLG